MLKHDRSLLVVCGSFVKILFFEIHIISNLWLTRLRKVLKWSICAEREEMFKWSLFVYFQFFEIWNIIIAAKWHFRLFRYLTRFTKLFQQFCLSSFRFFWRGEGGDWFRMLVMRKFMEKYLKVFVFYWREGKFHDAKGRVPWQRTFF